MNTAIDILARDREQMPSWLCDYAPGMPVGFEDFMSSRVAFYPGCGDDFSLVRAGCRSHSVHSFLYVDYGVSKRDMETYIRQFPGYHSIGHVEWGMYDLLPSGRYALNVDTSKVAKMRPMIMETPYCFMEVLERNFRLSDEIGPKRIAVVALFADGIDTFYQIFAREYRKAPYLMLLQDHGFGGNYSLFGKEGLLELILEKNGFWPEKVLCGDNTRIWDGYSMVKVADPIIGGMHNNERFLFVKD